MKSAQRFTASVLALISVISMSSCGKKNSDIDSETANATEAISEVTDYTEKAELTIDNGHYIHLMEDFIINRETERCLIYIFKKT